MDIWYRADTGFEYLYSRFNTTQSLYSGLPESLAPVDGEDFTMPSTESIAAAWGSITGDIQSQKDLIEYLEKFKEDIETGEIDLSAYVKDEELEAYKTELDNIINQLNASLQLQIQEEQQQRIQAITNLSETKLDKQEHEDFKTENSANLQTLTLKIEELENKIIDVKSLDPEVVVLYENGDTEYTNKIKDFMLSGVVTVGTSVSGNNITLHDTTVTATFMNLLASQDVIIKNTTLTGLVPYNITDALFAIHADGYVNVKDCTFTPETCYNGIDIGKNSGLAKSITINNVDFAGLYTNVAIGIYGLAENAVVTISNCRFADVGNVLKICNRTNVPFTVNIINCTIDNWNTDEFAGLICCEDITSETTEEANTNNIFSKVTINLQNVTTPNGKLQPVDLSTICGTQDSNQVIYVWDELRGHVAYGDLYPVINII